MQTSRTIVSLAFAVTPLAAFAAEPAKSPVTVTKHPLEFIDTSFENASPVWYEFAPDGAVLVHLLYDRERSSPNRAAGHIHFQLHAKPGSRLTLEFRNLDNVWNGVSGSIARELKAVVIAVQRNSPAEVVGFAPMNRRIGERRHTVGARPAPLRPVAKGLRARTAARVIVQRRGHEQEIEDRKMAQGLWHAEAFLTLTRLRVEAQILQ